MGKIVNRVKARDPFTKNCKKHEDGRVGKEVPCQSRLEGQLKR